jgi:hypothetical protein
MNSANGNVRPRPGVSATENDFGACDALGLPLHRQRFSHEATEWYGRLNGKKAAPRKVQLASPCQTTRRDLPARLGILASGFASHGVVLVRRS